MSTHTNISFTYVVGSQIFPVIFKAGDICQRSHPLHACVNFLSSFKSHLTIDFIDIDELGLRCLNLKLSMKQAECTRQHRFQNFNIKLCRRRSLHIILHPVKIGPNVLASCAPPPRMILNVDRLCNYCSMFGKL